jgi:hypothetical protein
VVPCKLQADHSALLEVRISWHLRQIRWQSSGFEISVSTKETMGNGIFHDLCKIAQI